MNPRRKEDTVPDNRLRGAMEYISGSILETKILQTKGCGPMAVSQVQTNSGIIEAYFFPDMYKDYGKVLQSGEFINLYGEIQEEFLDYDGSLVGRKIMVEKFPGEK